jgi:hypothetical protein
MCYSSYGVDFQFFLCIRPPPKIPEVVLPEKCVREVASVLRIEINRGFAVLRDIASGRDLKKVLAVSDLFLSLV